MSHARHCQCSSDSILVKDATAWKDGTMLRIRADRHGSTRCYGCIALRSLTFLPVSDAIDKLVNPTSACAFFIAELPRINAELDEILLTRFGDLIENIIVSGKIN